MRTTVIEAARDPLRSSAKAVSKPSYCHALTLSKTLPLSCPHWVTGGLFHKAQRKDLSVNNIFFLIMERFKYKQRMK